MLSGFQDGVPLGEVEEGSVGQPDQQLLLRGFSSTDGFWTSSTAAPVSTASRTLSVWGRFLRPAALAPFLLSFGDLCFCVCAGCVRASAVERCHVSSVILSVSANALSCQSCGAKPLSVMFYLAYRPVVLCTQLCGIVLHVFV